MKERLYIPFFVAGLCAVVFSFFYTRNFDQASQCFEDGVQQFSADLEEVKVRLEDQLSEFKAFSGEESYRQEEYLKSWLDDPAAIYLFSADQLVFWTTNKFPTEQIYALATGIHFLSNGWYYLKVEDLDTGEKLIGVHLLQKSFKQENQYFQNQFISKISLNSDWTLEQDTLSGKTSKLISSKGEKPTYLVFNPHPEKGTIGLVIIELLGIICIIIAFWMYSAKTESWDRLVSFFFLFTIRIGLLFLPVAEHLKATALFQPELYAASDYLPSLGDLFLHLLFFLTAVHLFAKSEVKITGGKIQRYLLVLLGVTTVFLVGILTAIIMESLVKHSSIPLDLSEIEDLNLYSLVTFILFASLLFGYRYLVKTIFTCFSSLGNFAMIHLIILACVFVLFLSTFFGALSWMHWVWVVPLSFIILFKQLVVQGNNYSLFEYLPEIILFSALFAFQQNVIKVSEEENTIGQILEREAKERDPIAEFLVAKYSKKIIKEKSISMRDSLDLNTLLRGLYHSKYLDKFNLTWRIDTVLPDADYQLKKGDRSSFTKINDWLFRKMTDGSMTYLTKIPLSGSELSVFFSSKEIPLKQGFPMLLASKDMEKMALNEDYSFAKYKKGKLLRNKGKYVYESRSRFFMLSGDTVVQKKMKEGYVHTLKAINGSTYVLTREKHGYLPLVANLSYMMFILSITLFFGDLAQRLYHKQLLFPKDFKTRLQYALLFTLFFSSSIIALGSIYFLKHQYNKQNFAAISEKIKSVELAINRHGFQTEKLHLQQSAINELAQDFFTDINLFDLQGRLSQTSQLNIFESGVLSGIQDPIAYHEIFKKGKPLHVQIENIEGMSYLSAYVPLYDEQTQLKGCLNLPYFAKTNELQSEINGFLITLVDIYLLLIVVAVAIALIISNRIIKPLKIIQSTIANFKLSDEHKNITWETNDEIGALVKAYNRMVNELSESAVRLAQAEREGAWKEMAQQVAHEIKNPLTPMKLNLQHFQMKWSGLTEQEKKEGFTDLTRNLVEQIDTLSAIAEQFSNFARIPDPVMNEIDLVTILKSSAGIYQGGKELVNLNCQLPSAMVLADKDQLLRIFNNVIKNGVQSVPQGKQCQLEITVKEEKGKALVSIQDNGSGIDEELKHLIFQPNFTTKTSGMGLGLAMVKKMVESVGGAIWFESSPENGTIFYLSFPLVNR